MISRRFILASAILALSLVATLDGSQDTRRGIVGQPAPTWEVTKWTNLPRGTTTLDIDDYRGRVLYLYCFQSWCPGCHSRGFPTLQILSERYKNDDDVAFVAVQTTFEGFSTNTFAAAKRMVQRYGLTMPVGHSGDDGARAPMMRRYRTGGTPWTIIIDAAGTVRFNDFHIQPEAAITLINDLRTEAAAPDAKKAPDATPPARSVRSYRDLVGKRWRTPKFDRTIPAGAPDDESPPARATLYRWWTDGCPYCRRSLPAIESLRKKYEARGLDVIAVYHPKPPRAVEDEAVIEMARAIGYTGHLAVDQDWSELKAAYLDRVRGGATSICVLVDAKGIIRLVHPGPEIFPSDDPSRKRQNTDYRRLDRMIDSVLTRAETTTPERPTADPAPSP